MSYDHVLLPSGVATTAEQVEAYLSVQQGQEESAPVAAIAAEVNRRNAEMGAADAFLDVTAIGGDRTGSVLRVPAQYDAIGFVRGLLFELATPRNYAVYDPQLAWLIDPAGHVPVQVTHGGAGDFPYLTEALAYGWVAGLMDPNPYLIVERAPHNYIQTYRNAGGEYTLEYRDGSADRHFGTTSTAPAEVAGLIWAWTTGGPDALTEVAWERIEL